MPELCDEADLNLDECPAGSKIGVVSASVPFLPPTMTGDVYMLARGLSVQFGYILRGGVGGSVKAPLKGDVFTVDADNNGSADFVRAVADFMPQVPWSTATINFTTPMLRNPSSCGAHAVKTKMTGWSGKGANLTANYPELSCDDFEPPVVTITSPADGLVTPSPSIPVEFTAEDNVGVIACDFDSGDTFSLAPGENTIAISCVDAAGNVSTATVTVTFLPEDSAPLITINSPADGSTTTASSVVLDYDVIDDSGEAPTCTLPDGLTIALVPGPNVITVTCTDGANNSTTASVTVTRGAPPVVVITTPVDGSLTANSTTNVAYTVDGASTIPAGTACSVNGTASTDGNTNPITLFWGANTVTVGCTNAFGSSADTHTVYRGDLPFPVITSPTEGTNTPFASINVQYTIGGATIPAGTLCQINGVTSTSTTTNNVPLALGANTITLICTNAYGSMTDSVTVNRGNPPSVVIVEPNAGTPPVSPGGTINVRYTVDGASTLSAGTICTVNGQISINPNVNSVTVPVGTLTITVSCNNSFGVDTETVTMSPPPTPLIAITNPTNGSTTSNSTTNVSFTVFGSSSIPAGTTCTVNGTATTSATSNTVTLAVGTNTISVSCTNVFGSGTANVTITRSAPALDVEIVSPADNSWTTQSSLNPTLSVSGGGSPASCTWRNNGSPVSPPIPLVNGVNLIRVDCVSGSDSDYDQITVRRDNASPGVSVSVQPAVSIPENPPAAQISWTVSDDQDPTPSNNCTLAIDGVDQPSAPHASPRFFNPHPGVNQVTVRCVDEAGNIGNGSFSFTQPGGPFSLIITSPTNGAVISASSVNVAYAINGAAAIPAGMTCEVNGVSSSSATTNPVALAFNTNTITVSCIAMDSTVGTASITVNRVPLPVVTITSPVNGLVTSNSSVNASFVVNGASSIPAGHSCTVNGAPTSSTTTNSVSLPIGNTTILVACTNAAGTGSASVAVTRMNLPVIGVVSPLSGSTSVTSPVNVSFTVNGSATIPAGTTCTVNGTPTTNATTNPTPLVLGSNTITIVCTNAAGPSTRPIIVLYAPTVDVEIVAPVDGDWISSPTLSPTLSITSGASVPGGITCSWTRNGSTVSPPIALVEGSNALVVTCTNGVVNDTDSVTITHDPTPPSVSITAELDESSTPGSAFGDVSWTVTDNLDPTPAGSCTLTQDGVALPGAPHSSPLIVALNGGVNTFTVTCVDEAGNSGSDTATVAHPNEPVVAITSPSNGLSTTAGSVNVVYTVDGSASIPAGTTCSINGSSSSSAATNNVALAYGANTITVSCSNVGGTDSSTVTVNRVSVPVVVITSPLPGTSTSASTTTVSFTVNGSSTIPSDTTCTVNGVVTTSTFTTVVPLVVGSNSLVVNCTNAAGTGSAAVTTVRLGDLPRTGITTFAPPSAPSTGGPNVSFTGLDSDSFECRMNNDAWVPCTSPWILPLGSPTVTQGENQYSVRSVNPSGVDPTPSTGFIWVDDRTYNATASVVAEPNDLVASVDEANDAGAHPDISASLTLEGYDDPRNVSVKFPDGLMGSLRAIPSADRCSLSQANSGDCPASAQIGVATATAQSSTDGQVTASGALYLVAPAGMDSSYAAGVAAEFDTISGPISGDLGDVRAVGGLRLTDQARNITVELTDIPRATTTGNRFHLLSGNLTVFGDAGPDDSKPLITNPHFCNDDLEDFSARPNQKQFVGTGEGYDGAYTDPITVDYIVDNCASIPFAPALDVSLSNPVAGSSTGLSASMSVPTGHSTLRALQVRLPSYVALNFPSFGVSSDMCSGSDDGSGSANNWSPEGTFPSYYSFDSSTCPPQSRVGTATLVTPLLDQPLTAYVYLIDKTPVPWLGLEVDPSIPGNPQGVKIGIVGFNSTPQEDPGCTSGCQLVVQSTFSSLPDVPLTSVDLEIGGIADRVSDGPGNPILNPNILNIAQPNSNTCRNSGTFATAAIQPWSTTSITSLTDPVVISGCSDPKINITSPANPTTGARIPNVANTTTTSPLNFTVNGAPTIPAGVSCDINGTPTSTTSNTVSLVTGVNNFTVTCSDAFGSGTASRRIDRGVPSVRFASPTSTSTAASTASVTLGVTANGAVLSGALPGTSGTTCNVNGTNVSSLSTAVIIPLVVGSNTLTATCTNSFGTGTAVFTITRT